MFINQINSTILKMGRKRLDDPKIHTTIGIKQSQVHILTHILHFYEGFDTWLEIQLDRYWAIQNKTSEKIIVRDRITTAR